LFVLIDITCFGVCITVIYYMYLCFTMYTLLSQCQATVTSAAVTMYLDWIFNDHLVEPMRQIFDNECMQICDKS